MKVMLLALILTTSQALYAGQTKLQTLAVVGHTTPIDNIDTPKDPKPLTHTDIQNIVKKELAARYSVHTPTLTLGQVQSQARAYDHVEVPIALVGCDALSGRWLKHYSDKLKRIHTIGYVVNCPGKVAYNALKKDSTIPLVPTQGKVLAKRFRVAHYPVLIVSGGVFQ